MIWELLWRKVRAFEMAVTFVPRRQPTRLSAAVSNGVLKNVVFIADCKLVESVTSVLGREQGDEL